MFGSLRCGVLKHSQHKEHGENRLTDCLPASLRVIVLNLSQEIPYFVGSPKDTGHRPATLGANTHPLPDLSMIRLILFSRLHPCLEVDSSLEVIRPK